MEILLFQIILNFFEIFHFLKIFWYLKIKIFPIENLHWFWQISTSKMTFFSTSRLTVAWWQWIYFDTGWSLYNPLLLMAKAHKHGYNILSVKVYTFLLMSHFHFWACSIWWTFLRTTKVTALSRILLPNCSKRNINLYTWWIHFILFPLEIQSKD